MLPAVAQEFSKWWENAGQAQKPMGGTRTRPLGARAQSWTRKFREKGSVGGYTVSLFLRSSWGGQGKLTGSWTHHHLRGKEDVKFPGI